MFKRRLIYLIKYLINEFYKLLFVTQSLSIQNLLCLLDKVQFWEYNWRLLGGRLDTMTESDIISLLPVLLNHLHLIWRVSMYIRGLVVEH